MFEDSDCPVVAIKAERTFWEKATILHQQAHRITAMPPGLSRHDYDLHRLAGDPVKDQALGNLRLLADVVQFKQRFYRCPWARYEDAKPGTFRLMPTDAGRKELKADYGRMGAMIFATPPTWGEILDSLTDLEDQINQMARGSRT